LNGKVGFFHKKSKAGGALPLKKPFLVLGGVGW
jgi:hypothetical protein